MHGCRDDCLGLLLWILRFKDARTNEDTITSKIHHERCIRRCCNAARCKVHHGESTLCENFLNQRNIDSFPLCKCCPPPLPALRQCLYLSGDRSHVSHRLHHIPRPRLPLRSNHRGTLLNSSQCFSQIPCTADERNFEGTFLDVLLLICRSEYFRFINEIHFDFLQNSCLHSVTNTALCHHGNRHCLLNFLDAMRVCHAGNSSLRPNIRRHPLECHDSYRTCRLRNFCLFHGRHIHDHSSL